MDFRNVVIWAMTIFIGAIFFLAGTSKLLQPEMWQQRFIDQWGLPGWLAIVTGILELAGGALILYPKTAVIGGTLIVGVMVGASGTHLLAGEYPNLLGTGSFAAIAGFVAWYRCPVRE